MEILIDARGQARCVYGEAINLATLGQLTIYRASQVEPDMHGVWRADLTAVGGPTLGHFAQRSDALAAEQAWLAAHWLIPSV
jgi:hypothetical protein